ncbi:Peptidase S8/S53 domain superfamily [Sesbania bispinosa]|nr:Peptidase S8/S53 domain superfamily [Sesbania bispinosa]
MELPKVVLLKSGLLLTRSAGHQLMTMSALILISWQPLIQLYLMGLMFFHFLLEGLLWITSVMLLAIAIGTFHATMHGITVACAGGNSGPGPGTVSNTAPWIITVGASTLDRKFQSIVELSNGQVFKGYTLSNSVPEDKLYPLTRAEMAKRDEAEDYEAVFCKTGTIDLEKAKGKILVCLRGDNARAEKSLVAFEAGAAGMILYNDKYSPEDYKLLASPHFLPTSEVTYNEGLAILSYINSTIGPNIVTLEILKPDITAPDVNIIAAYTQATSPSVVGLLKTLHPNWSPAAIKSAIMTAAMTWDNTYKPMVDDSLGMVTPYDYGSGHITPNWAMDPGLVYDLTATDYLNMLCACGYNQSPYVVKILDFNYPAIVIPKLWHSCFDQEG